jgi:hypothetical protein
MSGDDNTADTLSAGSQRGRRAIALAIFLMLPLGVMATAPISCVVAGGGDRCVSLAVVTALAYPFSVIYLLPVGIAAWRGLPAWRAIAALNVLAGWTVIGWVVALDQATSRGKKRPAVAGTQAGVTAGEEWTPSSWLPPPPGYPLPGAEPIVAEPEVGGYSTDERVDAVEAPTATTGAWSSVHGAPAWVREGAWPAGALVVKLCGGFEVYVEGRRIGDALRAKPTVLYLWLWLLLRSLLSPGSLVSREEVADEMSPGLDSRSQRRQLSNRLHDLSGLHPALSRPIRADSQALTFEGEPPGEDVVVADLPLLHELAKRGRRDSRYDTSTVANVESVLAGCSGEVLPEWDSLEERVARRRGTGGELIAAIRGRQTEDLATVTLALAQTHLESGSAGRAAELLRTVLMLRPDREDVARRLVAALTAAGRLGEADRVRDEYL